MPTYYPRQTERRKLYSDVTAYRVIHAKGEKLEANLFDPTEKGLVPETKIAGAVKFAQKEFGELKLPGVSLTLNDQVGGTSLEAEACSKDMGLSFILTDDTGAKTEAAFNSDDVRLFAELLLELCNYLDAAAALAGEDDD